MSSSLSWWFSRYWSDCAAAISYSEPKSKARSSWSEDVLRKLCIARAASTRRRDQWLRKSSPHAPSWVSQLVHSFTGKITRCLNSGLVIIATKAGVPVWTGHLYTLLALYSIFVGFLSTEFLHRGEQRLRVRIANGLEVSHSCYHREPCVDAR